MQAALLTFIASAGVIIVTGSILTHYVDDLAEKTGLGRLLLGSILLAGATSLPELVTDVSAVRAGYVDLAVGDLMGSSLFNLLILAIADLAFHHPGKMLSRLAFRHVLSGTLSITLTAFAAMSIMMGAQFERWSIGRVGIGSWLILIAYLLGARLLYFDQQVGKKSENDDHSAGASNPADRKAIARSLLVIAACAVVIMFTGPQLAHSAEKIAEITGLGGTFIGTTLVALSTSLPELVSTITALRLGAMDLAIGNIFGSNTFNMTIIVVLDFVSASPLLPLVSPTHAVTGICVIIVTSVVLMGQLYQVESRKRFLEPDAWLVILMILASLTMIYQIR
jgi:cation:H+ antiporter